MVKIQVPKTKASRNGSVFLYFTAGFFLLALFCLFSAMATSGWGSLLPTLIGILFTAVGSIFAAVGVTLKVVGRTPASALTDEQKVERTRSTKRNIGIFAAISGFMALCFFFWFVAPIDVVNAKHASLSKLKTSAPNGIEFFGELDQPNSIRLCNRLRDGGNCDTDSILQGLVNVPGSQLDYCKLIFEWVGKNKPKTWSNGYRRFEFNQSDPIVKMACVTGNLQTIAGVSGEYSWELNLSPNLIDFYLSTYSQEFGDVTNYDTYVSGVKMNDPVAGAMHSTLNQIGAWRKAHPNAANNQQNIREAIKYVELKEVQVFSKDKEAAFLRYQSQGDPNQFICLSVKRFDENFFGTKDPGHGYFPMTSGSLLEVDQFGYVSPTACG